MARMAMKKTEHYVWVVNVGPNRLAFGSVEAANKAADVVESHTGHLTEVEQIPYNYGDPDLKELIRLIREKKPNAL